MKNTKELKTKTSLLGGNDRLQATTMKNQKYTVAHTNHKRPTHELIAAQLPAQHLHKIKPVKK